MKKKLYIKPELELLSAIGDVITTSTEESFDLDDWADDIV